MCAAGQKASRKSSAGGRKYVNAKTMKGETMSNASANVLNGLVRGVEGNEESIVVG
jgi:hypothetical protein